MIFDTIWLLPVNEAAEYHWVHPNLTPSSPSPDDKNTNLWIDDFPILEAENCVWYFTGPPNIGHSCEQTLLTDSGGSIINNSCFWEFLTQIFSKSFDYGRQIVEIAVGEYLCGCAWLYGGELLVALSVPKLVQGDVEHHEQLETASEEEKAMDQFQLREMVSWWCGHINCTSIKGIKGWHFQGYTLAYWL